MAFLRPARRGWNYMEIKELSERMELAELQAREAIMVMQACRRQYARAYKSYMAGCRRKAWRRAA
ncbi:MAG: hypothetical protein DI551_00645 [Micavibrio aeruginosavorus]|uniref:Uncharacterized protein n=1 Tax=Micavibrio aeruginosavorus TaxID=349221 RepID=A0A2W5N5X4_9BACT|nr:MAG: hypothetical protein DI551_00645 [Micavibrio aeruginosavorus]